MATLKDRVAFAGRGVACILAAVPNYTLIPLPLTMLLTKRYEREPLLTQLHFMPRWARFCRKHILKIDLSVVGQELLPKHTKNHIYICNHQSYVDIMVLIEILNTVAFLSKSMVKYIPLIGQFAYAGGTIYIERGKEGSRQRALRNTIQMCKKSTAVVVFPEGTRSFDGQLRKNIHPGAIRAARHADLTVIPIGLDGTHHVVPKTMDSVNLGQRVAVTIGEKLDPKDFADGKSWIDTVWQRVSELHEQSRSRI